MSDDRHDDIEPIEPLPLGDDGEIEIPEPADLSDQSLDIPFDTPVDAAMVDPEIPEIEPVEELAFDSESIDLLVEEPIDVSGSLDLDVNFADFDPPDLSEPAPELTLDEIDDLSSMDTADKPESAPVMPRIDYAARSKAAANYGSMSYYKMKNLAKGREVPGIESGDQEAKSTAARMFPPGSGEMRPEGEPPPLMLPGEDPDVADFPLGDEGDAKIPPEKTKGPTNANDSEKAELDHMSDEMVDSADAMVEFMRSVTAVLLEASFEVKRLSDRLDAEDPSDLW